MKTSEDEPEKPPTMRRRDVGTGSVYRNKGSKRWSIQYYVDGKRRREKTGLTSKREARKQLTAILNQINKGQQPSPANVVRVNELWRDLEAHMQLYTPKSLRDYRRHWRHLEPEFGVVNANQLTSDTITKYAQARHNKGAANATINGELAVLRRALNLGRQASPPKVHVMPHIAKLPENNVRTGFVEDHQVTRLTAEAGEFWLRVFLELAFTYGWRSGELLGLKVHQLSFASRTIRLDPGTTKNKEGREVAMTAKVELLLRQIAADKNESDFVLTRDNGKPIRDFTQLWQRLCVRAGLGRFVCKDCKQPSEHAAKTRCARCGAGQIGYQGLLAHDLRRSAAKALRAAGVPESVIMAMSGWKTAAMFRRYAIVSSADQRAVVELLERARTQNSENSRGFARRSPQTASQDSVKTIVARDTQRWL